jgi:nitroreductase
MNKSSYKILVERRSIRSFKRDPVPETVMQELFELSRWAPTARNSQSYYFVVIKNPELIRFLSEIREPAKPIGNAPCAVAICADPGKSRRYIQDGCIAAYHFMLAAWSLGLGTCWIADMDRPEVKEKLGIPNDHYVATVTPLGWPEVIPDPPPRKPAGDFFRIIE